jgi:hypothetical protein
LVRKFSADAAAAKQQSATKASAAAAERARAISKAVAKALLY